MTVARINMLWLVFCVLTFGAAQAASAQAEKRFGLVIGYPATGTTTTTFRHSTATLVPSGFAPDRSISNTSNGVELDAMFGANYRLSDRFAVFGEAGLAYIRPTATSSSSNRLKSYSVGSRSDVGIAIYF